MFPRFISFLRPFKIYSFYSCFPNFLQRHDPCDDFANLIIFRLNLGYLKLHGLLSTW